MKIFLFLIVSSVALTLVAAKDDPKVCPDLDESLGCRGGSCKEAKKRPNKFWNIPTGVPLLVGYGTQKFTLEGNLPDDSPVSNKSSIRATQRKNFTTCCRKCKKDTSCKYFQFLNLGAYGGLCLTYSANRKPFCNSSMLVKTKAAAKCQNSSLGGDPHLVGAHGAKFDFSGMPGKSYCLLSDKQLNINMRMTGYLDERKESATVFKDGKAVRSWIRELGINWKVDAWDAHELRIVARSGSKVEHGQGYLSFMEYGDEVLPAMTVGQELTREGGLSVRYVAVEKSGPMDVDYYRVKIQGLLDMDVRLRVAHPLLRTAEDAEAHIGLGINYINHSPSIHGVLGQTYREGREVRAVEFQKLTEALHRPVGADSEEGQGFLDGKPEYYQTSSVMTPDCKFSAYQGWASDLALEA